MKLGTILCAVIVTLASLFAPTSNVAAQADISTAAQRCALAQSHLKSILKTRDLYTRVDRLQAYQYIYHRMDIFARRLERNNQAGAEEMRSSLTKLQNLLETFKLHYEGYDQAREAVVGVKDCRNNLPQFQDKLEIARSKREIVYQDVVSLQAVLETELESQLSTIYARFDEGAVR